MIILSLLLFAPITFAGKALNSSFDLFSAVVFVVAGPAVGFILQQIVSMISRIWDKLWEHTESNTLRQNWNRLRLETKGSLSEESTLDSMNSNYTFGITTSTALFIILLGYTFYLIIFPGSADYQYQMVFSNLANSINIDSYNSMPTGFSLADILRNSVSILVWFSIFSVTLLLAIFSKIEYNQVQIPLMLRLFKENRYCLYCGTKFCNNESYINQIHLHQEFYGESWELDNPDIKIIRERMNKENKCKKKLLDEARESLMKIIDNIPINICS